MESPSGNYRPQIIVALIGMAGVLGAAVLANWDKLTGTRSAAPAVAANAPAAAPPAAGAVDGLGDAQHNAYGAAAGALDDVAQQISAATIPDISGKWRSPDGFSFVVTQDGRDYSFQQYAPGGAWSGSGAGKLTGRKVAHDFRSTDIAAGRCSGDVAADGQSISGNCHDEAGGAAWGFRIDR